MTQNSKMPIFRAAPTRSGAPRRDARCNEQARLFTSDLSISEFLLVKEAGFDPVGLVVGSSIYHVGYQQIGVAQNQEMTVLTQAMYHARELAMTRMEEEAHVLGADGMVGVRLEVDHKEWGQHMAEFVAIGTAVRPSQRSAPLQEQAWPSLHVRPLRPGLLYPAAFRVSSARHGDGQLRVPRGAARVRQFHDEFRPEHGVDPVHAGALR